MITLDKQFFEYMYSFELALINVNDFWKPGVITSRECKLSTQKFGQLMGIRLDTDLNCVMDYFGLLKKSKGFFREARLCTDKNVPTRILHFQSIKIENLISLSPNLIEYFPTFKQIILDIRQFPKL